MYQLWHMPARSNNHQAVRGIVALALRHSCRRRPVQGFSGMQVRVAPRGYGSSRWSAPASPPQGAPQRREHEQADRASQFLHAVWWRVHGGDASCTGCKPRTTALPVGAPPGRPQTVVPVAGAPGRAAAGAATRCHNALSSSLSLEGDAPAAAGAATRCHNAAAAKRSAWRRARGAPAGPAEGRPVPDLHNRR